MLFRQTRDFHCKRVNASQKDIFCAALGNVYEHIEEQDNSDHFERRLVYIALQLYCLVLVLDQLVGMATRSTNQIGSLAG